ncbi:MAG TPA: hypothetical protein VF546_05910 [Pyrinomonadaceae bacterium]|jgi:hypothetical protein
MNNDNAPRTTGPAATHDEARGSYFDLDAVVPEDDYFESGGPFAPLDQPAAAPFSYRAGAPVSPAQERAAMVSRWPDDGFEHVAAGRRWAYGLNRLEAASLPVVLPAALLALGLLWRGTGVVSAHWRPGFWGQFVGWAAFLLGVVVANRVILAATRLAWHWLLTERMARRDGADAGRRT